MTNKQEDFAKRLKRYFDRSDEYYYCTTLQRMQRDNDFERFIQSMTIDPIVGRSILEKHKYNFSYGHNRK